LSTTDDSPSLEQALQRTEADADASLRAAASMTRALKRFRSVIHQGNLRDRQAALQAVDQALAALAEQVEDTRSGWDFPEASYFADGAYTRELLATAERMNLVVFEQDDRLYCYPSLIRVLPSERSVLVDRTRERRLRPSLLVEQLRELQQRPPRFKPQLFLDGLFRAYRVLIERHGPDALDRSPVEPLARIYELLTLLPSQSSAYSRPEFARDVYLLDRSQVVETRGYTVSFPASTGTRVSSGAITAITENGQQRTYWGISFSRAG
jgi:hypothetical protein